VSAILRLEGVTKRFGGLVAMNGVSLSVERGEIFAIIGPNGAGKTTLFNLISGFLRPDAGRILFRGTDITGRPPHLIARAGLARTFQNIKLFADMTVLDTVVAAALLRHPMREAQRRAREILGAVGLETKWAMSPEALSYPDKKLLELGRCLATEPQLVLLDELMAGLTRAEAELPLSIIRDLRAKGLTFVFVEHIMPIVMSTADRIAVINFGEKIAEGTPASIVRDPNVQKSYLGGEIEIA